MGSRKVLAAVALFAALFAFGCVAPLKSPALPPIPNSPRGQIVGNDRDSHGCIGSAGYEWCDALGKCMRPWEENCTAPIIGPGAAEPNGVPAPAPPQVNASAGLLVPPQINASPGPIAGNDSDSHGCKGSAGYTWCEAKQKCLRSWEENCTLSALEAKAQSYCGKENVAGVYICGDYVKVVGKLAGAGSTFYPGGSGNPIVCPVVSPEYMPPDCGELFSGNYCNDTKVC